MPKPKKAIITITTDFGSDNWFVGTMKGVIKGINPGAEIIDVCHNVRRFNIREAAFTLLNAYSYFPKGTVHLVVVDPGVGSQRLGIAVKTANYFFVAPDNGALSYVMEREKSVEAVSLENPRYMLEDVSKTFHGRDVFSPAAAHLSLDVEIKEFGPEVKKPVMLEKSTPGQLGPHEMVGHIIYIDHFGNCITDVNHRHLKELNRDEIPKRVKIKIRNKQIRRISNTYSDGKEGELICLFGSSGYLELSINKGNANQNYNLEEGGEFILKVL